MLSICLHNALSHDFKALSFSLLLYALLPQRFLLTNTWIRLWFDLAFAVVARRLLYLLSDYQRSLFWRCSCHITITVNGYSLSDIIKWEIISVNNEHGSLFVTVYVSRMFSSGLKALCWSNYVWSRLQQCIWMVFLASVVCVGLIVVIFRLFGQSWAVATGGHMCESTFGLGLAPASQGGRRSWAGRGGRWLWQDLEGNFLESRGQEHLGFRCSDWPATRPWWPRSVRCCCWRSHLERRRYIAYYPRTEMADWPSASPHCHCVRKGRWKEKYKWIYKCTLSPKFHSVHARESVEKSRHAIEQGATAKHTSPAICKSLGRAFRRKRMSVRNRERKFIQ